MSITTLISDAIRDAPFDDLEAVLEYNRIHVTGNHLISLTEHVKHYDLLVKMLYTTRYERVGMLETIAIVRGLKRVQPAAILDAAFRALHHVPRVGEALFTDPAAEFAAIVRASLINKYLPKEFQGKKIQITFADFLDVNYPDPKTANSKSARLAIAHNRLMAAQSDFVTAMDDLDNAGDYDAATIIKDDAQLAVEAAEDEYTRIRAEV